MASTVRSRISAFEKRASIDNASINSSPVRNIQSLQKQDGTARAISNEGSNRAIRKVPGTLTTESESSSKKTASSTSSSETSIDQATERRNLRRKQRSLGVMSKSAPDMQFDVGVAGEDDSSSGEKSASSWSKLDVTTASPHSHVEQTKKEEAASAPGKDPQNGRALLPKDASTTDIGAQPKKKAMNSKKTKISAKELGIKLDENTTSEELAEAVRRWKAEFKKEPPGDKPHDAPQDGAATNVIQDSPSSHKIKKRPNPPKVDRWVSDNNDASENSAGGKSLTRVIVRRKSVGANLGAAAEDDGKTNEESNANKPGASRSQSARRPTRRPSGVGDSSDGGDSQPAKLTVVQLGKDGLLRQGRSISTGRTSPQRPTRRPSGVGDSNDGGDSQPAKLTVVQLGKDGSVRQDRSISPGRTLPQRERSVSAGKPRPPPPGGQASVTRGNRTPTRRAVRSGVLGTPKGREFNKSPIRDGDLRPVSWRPEDSHLHKSGGVGVLPSDFDENDEIQKRLRRAGISEEQYKAILGAGLKVGLA